MISLIVISTLFIDRTLTMVSAIPTTCDDPVGTYPGTTITYTCNDMVSSFSSCWELEELTTEDCCMCFPPSTTVSSTSSSSSSSTTTESPTYIYDLSNCDGDDYCTITAKSDCQDAANELGNGDTIAFDLDTDRRVAGCSTNNKGNLRFNSDLDSPVSHQTNGQKRVLCKDCLFPADYMFLDAECDGTNYCTVQTLEDCEYGAYYLGHFDTKANLKNDSEIVAGCSINHGGGLRFNYDLETPQIHNTYGNQKVLCQKC